MRRISYTCLGLLSLCCFTALAGNPSASFNAPRAFTTRPNPIGITSVGTGIVAADFNNDGLADIAIFQPYSRTVSIILSYGNDSFRAPNTASGAGPGVSLESSSIVAADFNGDGFMDVAASSGDGNNVAIFLGNGDGSLRPPLYTSTPLWPIEVADLNGDGIPDLVGGSVSGSPQTSTINVQLGIGGGQFAAGTPIQLGSATPGSVLLGDIDGDGKIDIVFSKIVNGAGTIYIGRGKGDGTFNTPSQVTVPNNAGGFLIADANGDGKLDLLVFSSTSSPGVYTLLGNGNGTFQQPKFSAAPGTVGRYDGDHLARDLNGDGKLDLVLGNLYDFPDNGAMADSFNVLLGNGDGTFSYLRTLSVGGPSLAAADFNGDGKPDLAIGGNSQASVLINYGNANFQQPPAGVRLAQPLNPDPYYRVFWTFTGDFNSDGKPDVVTVGDGVQIFLSDGNGSLTSSYVLNHPVFPGLRVAAFADFNGDGRPDVVVVTPGKIEEFSNLGNGTLSPAIVTIPDTSSPAILDMKAADFNGDGKIDLAVLYQDSKVLVVYPGKGDGTFGKGIVTSTPGVPYLVDVNDYDGDGKLDAIVVDQLQGFSVYRGNGAGAFQFLNSVHYTNIFGIASGDVNGDHKIDLVTTNWTNQGAVTFIGNGDGTFQLPGGSPSRISGGMNYPRSLVLGDLNGDGFLDVIAANNGSNDITVLMGKGDGNFYSAQRFACAEIYPIGLALGSFYGQTIPDVAVLTTDRGVNIRHLRILKNGSPQ